MFVGDANQQIVERSQPDRDQVDRDDDARDFAHADRITDHKWALGHQKYPTDDVGRRGLRGKTEGDRQQASCAEHDFETDAEDA